MESLESTLKKRALKLATRVAHDKSSDPFLSLFTFVLGGEKFGFDLAKIKEVVHCKQLEKVPGIDTEVLGIVCIHGEIFSVIDLKAHLGVLSKESSDVKTSAFSLGPLHSLREGYVVVLRNEKFSVGIWAENISELDSINLAGAEKTQIISNQIKVFFTTTSSQQAITYVEVDSIFDHLLFQENQA